MDDQGRRRNGLGERERRTLEVLCNTLVPRVKVPFDPGGFYERRATDLGVHHEIEDLLRHQMSPTQQKDFRRLLRILDHPIWNLVLTGRPCRFTAMRDELRERYLLGWAHSRLESKRRGFHAVKRLALFLTYAKTLPDGGNPNWPALGYEAPSDDERLRYRHPEELRIEAVRPDQEVTITADACVIGSGAGGSVIAAELARLGHRVVLLESGSYRTADDFSQREGDAYDKMFDGRGLLTTEDLAIGVLAGRTAGGSTTINWMTCLPPPRWAREEWERDAGMAGLTSPAFDELVDGVLRRLNVSQDESLVNASNEVLRRGAEALGYRAGSDYEVLGRNARGCEGRCDFCFFGCIYGAKQSTLVTYLPEAYRHGAQFLFEARANRILVEGGKARGVEATYRGGGKEVPVHIKARAVVAAGGAVQTPALLSRSGIRFEGVGHGLRLDPTTALVGEFPDPIRMWKGPMQTIVVRKFQDTDEGHHGPWIEAAPGHPGLAALATPWNGGRAHKDAMRRLDRTAATIVLVRDVAEGVVATDSRGEPVLRYRLSPRDRANLVRGLQEAARLHRAAGAVRIGTLHLRECGVGDGKGLIRDTDFEDFLERIRKLGVSENGLALFSAHPMGSARAGKDPRTSAASPTGECHEVRNLWVGDGSLLPTAPGVNPMITIMALAARTAGYIHARLAGAAG